MKYTFEFRWRYTFEFRWRKGTLWRTSQHTRKEWREELFANSSSPEPGYVDIPYDEEWMVMWWPGNWVYLMIEGVRWAAIGSWWLIRNFGRML